MSALEPMKKLESLLLDHLITYSVIANNDRKICMILKRKRKRGKKSVRCNICVLVTTNMLGNYEINKSLQGADVTENLIGPPILRTYLKHSRSNN